MPTEIITFRRGRPDDARDFAKLVLYTAPDYFDAIFGSAAAGILEYLFKRPGNLFSFEHTYFMELDGTIAGMSLFYSYDKKRSGIIRLVLLLLRYMKLRFFAHLGALLAFGTIFARIKPGDLYSSNTALYPQFRGRGLGERLFAFSTEKAREASFKRVVVDVKADNETAIAVRKKLGFAVDERLPVMRINGKTLTYIRMVKVF